MTNKLSPEFMSPAERIAEACKLLATAIVRSRQATNHPNPHSELDFPSDPSGPDFKSEKRAGQ